MSLSLQAWIRENDINNNQTERTGVACGIIRNGPERLFLHYDYARREFTFVFTSPGSSRRLLVTKLHPVLALEHLYDEAGMGCGMHLDYMLPLGCLPAEERPPPREAEENADLPEWVAECIETGDC